MCLYKDRGPVPKIESRPVPKVDQFDMKEISTHLFVPKSGSFHLRLVLCYLVWNWCLRGAFFSTGQTSLQALTRWLLKTRRHAIVRSQRGFPRHQSTCESEKYAIKRESTCVVWYAPMIDRGFPDHFHWVFFFTSVLWTCAVATYFGERCTCRAANMLKKQAK